MFYDRSNYIHSSLIEREGVMPDRGGIDFREVSRTQEQIAQELTQSQRTREETQAKLQGKVETQRQATISQRDDEIKMQRQEARTLEQLQRSLATEVQDVAQRNREAAEASGASNQSNYQNEITNAIARQEVLETAEQVLGATVNESA